MLDVRKEISFCKKVGIPVIGVVENMSGFICPNCKVCRPPSPDAGVQFIACMQSIDCLWPHTPFLSSVMLIQKPRTWDASSICTNVSDCYQYITIRHPRHTPRSCLSSRIDPTPQHPPLAANRTRRKSSPPRLVVVRQWRKKWGSRSWAGYHWIRELVSAADLHTACGSRPFSTDLYVLLSVCLITALFPSPVLRRRQIVLPGASGYTRCDGIPSDCPK